MAKEKEIKIVCQNRRAHHDFSILKTYEAGLVLLGSEVKSLRKGQASLNEAYATFKEDKLVLYRANIPPYDNATHECHEPDRLRDLLIHKSEVRKLKRELKVSGVTLVPLKIYFKGAYAKVEIALAQGRKSYDKREALKKKSTERDLKRIDKVI